MAPPSCTTLSEFIQTFHSIFIVAHPKHTRYLAFMRRSAHITFLTSACTILLMWCSTAYSQVGGYAGGFLRRPMATPEVAMAGIYSPWSPDASALFSNSASLSELEGPSGLASFSSLSFPQQAFLLGFGTNVGEFAGIGVGVDLYQVSDIPGRTFDERSLGTISSQDLAFMVGGGIGIGPGSVGATFRYLRYDVSSVEQGSSGYALDLSGTLTFQERIFFAASINNIAGMLSGTDDEGPREEIPLDTRLGVSYLIPLDERTETMRTDPTGLPRTRQLRPDSYVLIATEGRTSEVDSVIIFGAAVETIPVPEMADIGLGLRGGFNTLGDITFGFFFDTSFDVFDRLRLDLAIRREYQRGDITYHTTLHFFP